MKYNEKNKPLVCMMTQSTCYKQTRKFTPKGVLWHSTGANNPNLKRYVQPDDNAKDRDEWLKRLGRNEYHNDWNHINHQAGLNFWIGKLADGTVAAVQTMPWDYRPWGCGSGSKGSCNNTHIQFEICEDALTDKAYFDACYKEACEMTAYLCKLYGIDPKGKTVCDGVSVPTIIDHTGSHSLGLGSGHADVQHWFKRYGKTMDNVRNDVAEILVADAKGSTASGSAGEASDDATDGALRASDLKGLAPSDVIKKVGPLFTADQKKSGVLASVSLAQFCLESGYGTSELAVNSNNCFGMKCSLSGNTWAGSTWDGKSKYSKKTGEQKPNGEYYTVTADFRKYGSIADSIADHSAYLTGAMNGKALRYAGLKGCTDYKKAFQIIKDGGYATSLDYVSKLCAIVEKWDLTKYDATAASSASGSSPASSASTGAAAKTTYYRVRKSWDKPDTQIGAFTLLKNAKACVSQNLGYKVFDEAGQQVYPKVTTESQKSESALFKVKVSIDDLNIRSGPGTDHSKTGKHTGKGVFTIVDTASGQGSKSGWGLLKSYANKRNGWIALD